MKRLLLAALITTSSVALAQNRGAELDKAIAEVRIAYLAFQEAEKRRDAGVESRPGERLGTIGGGARQTDARGHYAAALMRWNDLK